ncbi:ABC transporter ATP-binding protein [Nocardioides zeae]|uniref:ATP-binding cassette subfamily C protein n=1 Tax=Nocardioides zeae TaxID=1457234 RepID=A0AAJ1X435_9ACTN|nr:ABC transporter ATP-binding protein [Nocardioides zeae]MDQ1105187.1 ATP-binding cassette subfamily C protein [Nocardioides zeae]
MSGTATLLPVASARETARVVGRLLDRRRARLVATVLLLLLASATALAVPRLLGEVVDAVARSAPTTELAVLGGAVAAAGGVAAALGLAGGRILVACLQEVVAELRENVVAAAIALDAGTVESAGSGDVVSRVTRDVEAVTEAASDVLPQFVRAGFTIALTLVGLAVLDPWLVLAALTAAPLQAGTTRWFVRRSRPLYERLRREESSRGQAIIETVDGAATVQAHGRQQQHLATIAERSLRAVETGRDATRVRNRFFAGLNTAEFLGLAAVLAVGFWRADAGALTVGGVTAGALYFHRLFGPVGSLLESIDDLQRASVGLERLVGIIGPGPSTRSPGPSAVVRDAAVEVCGLSLAYGAGPDVLRDVTLRIAPGTTTVLVGASGSGKSTLARAVAGLLPVERGEVLVGGVPAARARRPDGRPAVLLVTQEVHLFTGTVADDVRLGRPAATDAEVRGALDRVGAAWVHDLPDGVATVLGPDTDEGRAQQVALARALLADPPVLVLDEATAYAGGRGAGLDDAVDALRRGRTTLVVAHRLATTLHADTVVVLADGRIVEQGTHAELVARGGAFAALWEAWSSVPR